jgi:hypothetical protein
VEPALSPGVGRSDGSGRRGHILPREISGSVQSIELRHGQSGGTRLEKSAEALSRFRSGVIFDRVNHDILMSRIARRIGDKRLLGIMRRFFQDGLMQGGVCVSRDEESLGSLPSASTVRKRTSGSHPSPPVACVVCLPIAYRVESTAPAVTIPAMRSPSMRCNDAVQIFKQLSVDDPARYTSLVTQVCDH